MADEPKTPGAGTPGDPAAAGEPGGPHDSAARGALTGKTALVTGAARRVGAAIARVLHGAGATLLLHYRSSGDDATRLAAELNESRPGSAGTVECDLLQMAELPGLVAEAARRFGGLDILVNNASTFYPTPFGDITEIDWDDLIGTNVKAPLFLAQAAAPLLHARQGLIINLADIHGTRPLRRYPVYSLAKAGVLMLTKSLARELGPQVRVNAVAPGPVMWPEGGLDEALRARIIAGTALKRAGSAMDVARACLFFAAEAPYVTGQVLAVDGGRSIGW
jgi:pteridine reductase